MRQASVPRDRWFPIVLPVVMMAPLGCFGDEDSAAVARAHSQDMCDREYFDHTNPDGDEPYDRLDHAGVSWTAAGENITATQSTAQGAMDTWMGSSTHRANILSESFGRIGVGYVPCDGEHLWTQVFTN
ncbi:MAG: CAP domain-containing protein [Myxococcota bacterium]